MAAPRGSARALNNILVSKAAAAIYLCITYKFFGKSERNESMPMTVVGWEDLLVHGGSDAAVIGFEGSPRWRGARPGETVALAGLPGLRHVMHGCHTAR